MFDVYAIRKDFPILEERINEYPLVYLDNAATTQKPLCVMDCMLAYYQTMNANVHRGVHTLSAKATEAYEHVRSQVRDVINAVRREECIFVRGTTEAMNLIAFSYAQPRLAKGDRILVSEMEHHSNLLPWQWVAEETGAVLDVIPCLSSGQLCMETFLQKLTPATKIVAVAYASNALGTIHPVHQMIEYAHQVGAVVVLDGAQSTAHLTIDVQALNCDFYAFSSHKMYGPTGVGVLWGRESLLNEMRPYQRGGEMIHTVSFEGSKYAPLPYKFEAGTPAIAEVIGFGETLRYLAGIDRAACFEHEMRLMRQLTTGLSMLKGYRLLGDVVEKVPVVSFVHETIHPHDIGTILDTQGIAVRTGHHCAMPLMNALKVPATTRVSLGLYNTQQDIDACLQALAYVNEVFQ